MTDMEDNKSEMQRPEPIDIESTFNLFVTSHGGRLVSSMFGEKIVTLNADYYFPQQNVIAELKCFENDMSITEGFERMEKLFERWLATELIKENEFFAMACGRIPFPKECYQELWASFRKSIDYVLDKATKQVRETRTLLNKPEALGFLLLCNDGNYGLSHQAYISIIADLMTNKYPTIVDGFVYFTYNQTATIPGSELDWQLWQPSYSNDAPDSLVNFVDDFGAKYYKFMEIHTKVPIVESRTIKADEGLGIVKQMEHIPKEYVFGRKKRKRR